MPDRRTESDTAECNTNMLPGPQDVRQHIADLFAAAQSADFRDCRRTALRIIESGISVDALTDICLPAVASLLGDDWVEDRISFTAVSIGTSRLQRLLHDLDPDAQMASVEPVGATRVFVVNGHKDDHTLGVMILAAQLRRRGFSVGLMLGAKPRDLSQRLASANCQAVLISASAGSSLVALRDLVRAVRSAEGGTIPVIVGGSILRPDVDIQRLTGADHATSDLEDAISVCGLSTGGQSHGRDAPSRTGGKLALVPQHGANRSGPV